MSLPPNEPLFKGFTGLLSLITSRANGTVTADEVIGLYAFIENTVATSTNIHETIRDVVDNSFIGTNGVNIVVDDPGNTVTFSLDVEYTQDMIANFTVAGSYMNIVYDDTGNTLTFSVDEEAIQDMIGGFIVGTNGIIATYDDTGNEEILELDTEYVQDLIANFLVAGNAISLNYNDVLNTLTVNYSPTQTQYDFNDNTTLHVIIGNHTTERAVVFDYTLETTGNVYQVGNVQIVHNGTSAVLRHEFVGVPNEVKKVTYATSLSGNDIRFSITANAVGANLKLKITNRSSILKTV